jgi:hypothetical protein
MKVLETHWKVFDKVLILDKWNREKPLLKTGI